MKRVRRVRKWVVLSFILVCLISCIYYSYEVITWAIHVKANNKIIDKIEKIYIVDPEKEEFKVDFKSLKEINPDTIAYIKVNNTNISYVVVKGTDNSYYLTHNFEKKWNKAGWIFGDYHNKFDGEDKNLIIYGHNMKDGSMFDSLKDTITKEWYENKNNHKVTLITEDNIFSYQVFSSYSIAVEDYYINTIFTSNEEFNKFINTLKSRTVYDYGVEVTPEDKILTLSSCLGEGKKRVVLHAKLIDKKENIWKKN